MNNKKSVSAFFSESSNEDKRIKIKNSGNFQKLTDIFLKQLYSKLKQTLDNNWMICLDSLITTENNWIFEWDNKLLDYKNITNESKIQEKN